MTSQKTIERCRNELKSVKEANEILLKNNLVLAEENSKLRGEIKRAQTLASEIEQKRVACASKCERIISEKDRVIAEKQRYIDGCRSTFERLKDGKWFYEIKMEPDGKIAIIHRVMPG